MEGKRYVRKLKECIIVASWPKSTSGGRDEDAIDRSEGGPGEILGGIAGETLALDTMNLKWDQSFSL